MMEPLRKENDCVRCGTDTSDSLFCGNCGTAVLHNLLIKTKTTADYDPCGQDYAPWREPVKLPPRLLKPMNTRKLFRNPEPWRPAGQLDLVLLLAGE